MSRLVPDTRRPDSLYGTRGTEAGQRPNIVSPTQSPPQGATLAQINAEERPADPYVIFSVRSSGPAAPSGPVGATALGAGAVVARPLQTFPDSSTIAARNFDTGDLPAGTYDVYAKLQEVDAAAANRGLILEHRNAADNATLATLGGALANPSFEVYAEVCTRVVVAAGESIRIIQGSAAASAAGQAPNLVLIVRKA